MNNRSGGIFKGSFEVEEIGDTYLDMYNYSKGYVWVNGYALGRYWNIGPQYCLYLPGVYMNKGTNEIVILELETNEPGVINGCERCRLCLPKQSLE